MKRLRMMLLVVTCMFSVGCLATVQQKLVRYGEIGTNGLNLLRVEWLAVMKQADAARGVVQSRCAVLVLDGETNLGDRACKNLAGLGEKLDKADYLASKASATAAEIGDANRRAVAFLLDLETAIQEANAEP